MDSVGWPSRLLGTLALAMVLLFAWPAAPAHAHAGLLESDPADGEVLQAAPEQVTLRFTEPVSPALEATRLDRADGTGIDLVPVSSGIAVRVVLPELEAGFWYRLSWRVISADGHGVEGTVSFAVGSAPPVDWSTVPQARASEGSSAALIAIANAAQYLGVLLVAGLMVFEVLILRSSAIDRLVRRVARGGALTAAAAAILLALLAVQPWQLSLVVALTAIAPWLPLYSRPGRALALGAALAAAGSLALAGHSVSRAPVWLLVGADLAHVFAAAIWFGGLLALLLFLRRSRGGQPADAVRVVSRYGGWAMGAVLGLAASGAAMAVLILPDWSALIETAYGRTLLIKLGVVAVAVLLSAVIHGRMLPAVHGARDDAAAWGKLRQFLLREAAVIGVALAVTGVLVSMNPQGA